MSTSLKMATVDELEAELAKRKQKASGPPPKLASIDWAPLLSMIEENVRQLAEEGRYGKDFEHYVYEVALTCVYGNGYWDWRRKVRDE